MAYYTEITNRNNGRDKRIIVDVASARKTKGISPQ